MNYHPDKHSNSEFFKQRFQEIQQAYETLANASSRAVYDSKYARFTSGTTNTSTAGDTAKLKDLTLKVSKLEASVKEKEQMLVSLVSKVKAKESECERLQKLNADFGSQIGSLTTILNVENAKAKSVTSLSKAVFTLMLAKHPIISTLTVVLPILSLLVNGTFNNNSSYDKINLVQESINADTLVNRGKYAELLERMNELISSNKPVDESALERNGKQIELADLHTFRAYAKSRLGNDTGAIKDLTYVIRSRSVPSSIPYYRRALLKWKIGNGSGYFIDINRALSLQPDLIEARANRAAMLFTVGRYSKAIEDFRGVYKSEPSNADNLASIGDCYYKMHEHKSACAIWNKAKELGSSNASESLNVYCR